MRESIRLNKFLSESGLCSRREADIWIASGRVTVNDVPAQVGMRVSDADVVAVDGNPVCRRQSLSVVAFYKPKGYTCTSYRGDQTGIFRNFDFGTGMKYVGRLDKESEGLLLLTNDGDLCNEIAKARNGHEKEYVVTVNRSLTEVFLKSMSRGVRIHDSNRDVYVVTRPCKVVKQNDRTFSIVLTQGYNRQIRKMCEQFGYKVTKLKRIRVMNVLLKDMKPGEIRKVTEEELTEMRAGIANGKNQGKAE